ncbi:hypothetical protein DIPPA_10723 [Diplonema papillatum]|nr:hypothetical protein DIPPA_10723 [Diplonema papillatum]
MPTSLLLLTFALVGAASAASICGELSVYDAPSAEVGLDNPCPDGRILASQTAVEACLAVLCPMLSKSSSAVFDGPEGASLKRDAENNCVVGQRTGALRSFVCDEAPPLTTYGQVYGLGFYAAAVYVVDVAIVPEYDLVVVANSEEMSVVALDSVGRFKRTGRLPGYYYSVKQAASRPDLVYALQSSVLNLVNISNPSAPHIEGTTALGGYSCGTLYEHQAPTQILAYVSCGYYGVWVVDVTSLKPVQLGNGTALVRPKEDQFAYANSEGLWVDEPRKLLFVAFSAYQYGVRMFDLAIDAVYPPEVAVASTDSSAYQIHLLGTILFVAASDAVVILDTTQSSFNAVSSCCEHGPELNLRGLYYYEGLLYASDYYGYLVVVNATVPASPYYVGHRTVPATSSKAAAREGIQVGALQDGVPRVFQAAYGSGFAVWSDREPLPTPAPPTFAPPPPPAVLTCDHVYYQVGPSCPAGDVLMPLYDVETGCPDICSQLPYPGLVRIAGISDQTYYYRISPTGTCTAKQEFGTVTPVGSICGTPPPHVAYIEVHAKDVLSGEAEAFDVAVLGRDSNEVAVATSTGLTILRAEHPTGFSTVSHLPLLNLKYRSVQSSAHDPDVLYALHDQGLDIVSLSPADKPEVIGSASLATAGCVKLAQLRRGTTEHVVFASCGKAGVFAVDVRDHAAPKGLNSGKYVAMPLDGIAHGLLVDDLRDILFCASSGTGSSVYMYDVETPVQSLQDVKLLDSVAARDTARDFALHLSLLFVAGGGVMEIFDTETRLLAPLATCCTATFDGPSFNLYGVDYYEGLIYASDYNQKLVVMNVTEAGSPHYLGHRRLPVVNYRSSYGQEGIVVHTLGDGGVRVLQPAGTGGLMVFSDVEPPPTPFPPTPLPFPPAVEPDCSLLYLYDMGTNPGECKAGDAKASRHLISTCFDQICAKMPDSSFAWYDSPAANSVFGKEDGDCGFQGMSGNIGINVCAPAPLFTAYVQQYNKRVFPEYSSVVGVAVADAESDIVFVASTNELSVMQLNNAGWLHKVGRIPSRYTVVVMSEGRANIAYGLENSNTLNVIDVTVPSAPKSLSAVDLASYQCEFLAQFISGGQHFVYASCSNGIYAADVTTDANVLALGSDAIITPSAGENKGILVDTDRSLMFVATTSRDTGGGAVQMYVLSAAATSAIHAADQPTSGRSSEVTLQGTVLYVAASAALEIYDTQNSTFTALGICCQAAPDMDLVGLTLFDGLVYAADHEYGQLVVINASVLSAPFFVGHRTLPSTARGMPGVVATMMKDGAVRVFVNGDMGGLIAFSDKPPGQTPAPPTPRPQTPPVPLDCAHAYIANETTCQVGVLMSEHFLFSCFDESLCQTMTVGTLYLFETLESDLFAVKISADECKLVRGQGKATAAICGSPAPHTAYVEGHKRGLLQSWAYVTDVAIMGESTKEFVAAHSYGLSVFSVSDSTGVELRGAYGDDSYYAVIAAADNKDIVFATQYGGIEVINFAPPTNPTLLSRVTPHSDLTYHMEQWYVPSRFHVLYASSPSGIYAIDVMDKKRPVIANGGSPAATTLFGGVHGMILDRDRSILFAAADTVLHAFNATNATAFSQLGSVMTGSKCSEIRLLGTVVVAACGTDVEVFETAVPSVLVVIDSCCSVGDLKLRGMEIFDGLVYASDSDSQLVVINVTEPQAPYFVGLRKLPPVDGATATGDIGVAVGAFDDGIVRVLVAGNRAGIYAFSDTQPAPTPAPPTLVPVPPYQFDCSLSALYIHNQSSDAEGKPCKAGDFPVSRLVIEACMDEVCPRVGRSGEVGYDGPLFSVLSSELVGECSFTTSFVPATKYICGPPPPFTTYRTEYEDGFIPDWADVLDVLAAGPTSNDVLVATDQGLSILSLRTDGRFQTTGFYSSYSGYSMLVLAEDANNVVIGIGSDSIEVLDINVKTKITRKSNVYLSSYNCEYLAQYKKSVTRLVYASCASAAYVVDVSSLDSIATKKEVTPSSGSPRGIAVDELREVMHMGTTGPGIVTFNLSDPVGPEELVFTPTASNVYRVRIFDTMLYAATEGSIVIFNIDTTDKKPVGISFCCNQGPELSPRDVTVFNGLIYVADYYEMLVVINAKVPTAPHYLSHRDLPSDSYGTAIDVSLMPDSNVHIFVGGMSAGLVVFSDVEPAPTPMPPTPLPSPPRPSPFDCSRVSIVPMRDRTDPCPAGRILANEHVLNKCGGPLCASVTDQMLVAFDSHPNNYWIREGSCMTTYKTDVTPTHAICEASPPHSMYLEQHKDDVLLDGANAIDVAVLENKLDVIVATTKGLTILHAQHSVGFKFESHVDGNYVAVLPAEGNQNMAYALLVDQFDVISLSPPEKPDVTSVTFLPSSSCKAMAQYRKSNEYHVVYIACGAGGVLGMDTRDHYGAKIVNTSTPLINASPSSGLTVDESRKLLFIVTTGNLAGIHMVDISNPLVPKEVAFNHTEYDAHDIKVVGTVAYVAATDKLEIWETRDSVFKQISWCCLDAPPLELVSVHYWDGLVFASHKFYKMVVINVTDPEGPEYVGHRNLPPIDGSTFLGKKIVVAEMDDGIVRVFQAAERGGLIVFSDEEPRPTPAPETALPPPPIVPPNCAALYVNTLVNNMPCQPGGILMSSHLIDACLSEVCGMLQADESVGYDMDLGYVLTNKSGTCEHEFVTDSEPTRYVCGPPPQHMTFMEVYREEYLPATSIAVDVCALGTLASLELMLVATSAEVTVMRVNNNGQLSKAGSMPGAYTAIITGKSTLAYALADDRMDVISVDDRSRPDILDTISFTDSPCVSMAQYKTGLVHYVYAACGSAGIFAVDVWDNNMINAIDGGTARVKPENGIARGMTVDIAQSLLMVATRNSSGLQGVYMYGLVDPRTPKLADFVETNSSATDVALIGSSVLAVAATEEIVIYSIASGKFSPLGSCCHFGPDLNVIGIASLGGMLYAADWQRRLVAIDVTDFAMPYYVGHRDLPPAAAGNSDAIGGILAARMSDNVVRVVMAAESGGLIVFSDHRPAATRAPVTIPPPPPPLPVNCSALRIVVEVEGCPDGLVLEGDHIVEDCNEHVCEMMAVGDVARLEASVCFKKTGTDTCTTVDATPAATHLLCGMPPPHTSSGVTVDQYVCGPPPPYTAYMQRYDNSFLASYSRAVDVTVTKPGSDAVFVATTLELVALQVQSDRNFRRKGYIREAFVAVVPVEGHDGLLFALASSLFEVIDFTSLADPFVSGSSPLSTYSCANLEQVKVNHKHYVFAACNNNGIYLIDSTHVAAPFVVGSAALIRLPSGPAKGMFVDATRLILWVTSTSFAVHMYNITDPTSPGLLDTVAISYSAYEVVVVGTVAYVAASQRLLIYETEANKFEERGWCCHFSPPVHLVGLAVYNGLAYVSDWTASLVVMNVTDPLAPYYIGHRELPPGSGGNSNGKEGVVVSSMADGVVRVVVAADNGGVVVFSDVPPAATPAPLTPIPLPPRKGLDCSTLSVFGMNGFLTAEAACQDDLVPVPEHVVVECGLDVCDLLRVPSFATFETYGNKLMKKAAGMDPPCALVSDGALTATHAICWPAPPSTRYYTPHRADIMTDGSQVKDVTVLGYDNNDIVVATSSGLVVMHALHSIGFRVATTIPGDYAACLPSENDADIVFALRANALDVVTLTPPESPIVLSSAQLNWGCQMMAQHKKGTAAHVLYVACHGNGIFVVDVLNVKNATSVYGTEPATHTKTGETKGITVDDTRSLMFASTWGTDAAIHLYDIAQYADPVEISEVKTSLSVYDLEMEGTLLFCAADKQVLVYETEQRTFAAIGACCSDGFEAMFVGLDYFDGYLYVSDYRENLFVLNATDPTNLTYAGHRGLPPVDGYFSRGKEGITAARLGDGIVRVFQAADAGGLWVFSDEPPVATPAPDTAAPPPAEIPPDCGLLYVHEYDGDRFCLDGDVVAGRHVIDLCMDAVCALLTDGGENAAGFDGGPDLLLERFDRFDMCAYTDTREFPIELRTPRRYVCGTPPPHTAYMSVYSDGFLPSSARTVDVAVMGQGEDEVFVATTSGLVVFDVSDGNVAVLGSLSAAYAAILPSSGQPNVLYGIRSSRFDVVSVLDFRRPTVIASVTMPTSGCSSLAQLGRGSLRTVFVGCTGGVFAVDASANLAPALVGEAAVAQPAGDPWGLLVDEPTMYLYVSTSNAPSSVFMYKITAEGVATEKAVAATTSGSRGMVLDGTYLLVAEEEILQVYQTKYAKLTKNNYCCTLGPKMALVGISLFNGMVYASDWRGVLVVMNATVVYQLHYTGHRELPSASGGNANAKGGIVVTRMGDNQVRVLQAADKGGFVVFSDTEPPPTPQPDTPMPAPPSPPFNCEALVVSIKADGVNDCPLGFVSSPLQVVNQCTDALCAKMEDGDVAAYDGATTVLLKKSPTACVLQAFPLDAPTKTVCGIPPPHTAYLQAHGEAVLNGVSARDVAVLGSDSDDIVVATSGGLSVLTAWASTGFERVGDIDGNFYAVIAAAHDKDLLYALTADTLEVVSLTNVRSPDVVGRVTIPSRQCRRLAQMRLPSSQHIVYASCQSDGVYAIDVLDNNRPAVVNSVHPVLEFRHDNVPQGLLIDSARQALFVGVSGAEAGIYAYRIEFDSDFDSNAILISFTATNFTVYELVLSNKTLFIAADDKLEVYDTSDILKLTKVGWCCQDGEAAPDLHIVGLTFFDNMIYASDRNQMLVVFNVTEANLVHYIGHRNLPRVNGMNANGKEGIVAAQLQDGVIRVFQAADQGGLMVFSDEEPIMTPSPRTPMPPPPFLPPDCPALYVHEPLVGDDVNPCKEGDILMDRHIVDVCMNDVCQKLADGEMAGFVEGGKAVQKAGTGCSVVDDASLHFRFVCGPAPPYTSYVMQYPAGPYVVDSALVGSDGRYIAASTDTHVMFYRLTSAAYLMEVAKVENPGYKSVVQAKHNPNVVYALRYNALDVIDAQDPTRPAVVGTLPFASTRCARLIQMKTEVTNVLYVSCHDSGIFVVDVRSDTAPMLLNDGNGLTTDEGEVKGVLVDSNRTLLFTVTWGVSALHMFDVSAPAVPVLLATEPTDAAAFEMTQNEFLIYIAAGAELEIVDTSDGKLQRLSSCCSHGPGMWIVGLAFFNNLIYASDWTGKLVVMNVTTGGSPYYVGHRDLPAGSNGKEGSPASQIGPGCANTDAVTLGDGAAAHRASNGPTYARLRSTSL